MELEFLRHSIRSGAFGWNWFAFGLPPRRSHSVSAGGALSDRLLSLAGYPNLRPMLREDKIFRRSALLSFRFLFTAVLGSVLMGLVCAFGSPAAQLAVLGSFVSILGGLFLAYLAQQDERERHRDAAIESLSVPLALASDPELFRLYRALCQGLTAVAQHTDSILRDVAVQKLGSVAEQITGLGEGKVVFALTEGWRTVYERLLSAPGLKTYRSVAWVRNPSYWQDVPGRQSMRVNFEAVLRGLLIERVIILHDDLWPVGATLPTLAIRPWIEEQHNHGLWILLVRESEIAREPDLLADTGLYGTRAVGVQELDEHSRTLRFTLDLDPQSVRVAEERWRRLALYAVSFRSLLDRAEGAGYHTA